ncbi:BZ3500_MvSof-1268-A1-R1_Chr7-3g09586 [Microbotryum saponariae]|uniref:BZ3500_MvSof-1268-A1-R1_Chr7-3g09586 protein n=1 Tax=Microbotryum saponariae TaxID=289078 RepID=A0A2X0LZX2_9BASI|nr:BZ3501_MvSof-1269-A2-R1_Chr7-2g09309 [Microbotryum saponariae]SDA02245.1 BZ3500_MvSof-1268-A1-R1_Chr7-3g09586 [Microbotryum saponariae]
MSLARVRRIWLSALQNTQFIVTTLTIVLILRLRTAHALWFGAGTLCAAFSAKVLKRFIRQPRPDGALHYETTYGMPSTHSSSIAYFGTYLTLSSLLLPFHPRISSLVPLYVHIVKLGSDKFISGENLIRLSLACLFVVGASSVCWSRIRLGHHTRAQVIVGASLGTGVACVWFVLWIGVDQALELTSRIRTGWRTGHFKLAYPWIPTPIWDGVHEYGTGWERIAEDTLLLSLEIWASGEWRQGVGEMGKVLKGVVVGGMSREEL